MGEKGIVRRVFFFFIFLIHIKIYFSKIKKKLKDIKITSPLFFAFPVRLGSIFLTPKYRTHKKKKNYSQTVPEPKGRYKSNSNTYVGSDAHPSHGCV